MASSRPRTARAPLTRVLLALVLLAGAAIPARAQMTCDPCAVGVVFDGPWARNDELRAGFEQEIATLAAPRHTIVFPAGARRVADWTLEGARAAVEALLADPDVDIVLTYGPVSSSHAINRAGLPKPVVAAFVLDPEAQGFPLETTAAGERVSGVPNLAYITFTGDRTDEIGRLREVVPFDRLTYLANEALLAAVPVLEANLRRGMRQVGGEAAIVRVGASVDAALAALPPETEAVYVTPLTQLPAGEFDRLVRALIERRLPAFSYWGRSEGRSGPVGERVPRHRHAPARPAGGAPRAADSRRRGRRRPAGRLPAQPATDRQHGDGARHRGPPGLARDDRGGAAAQRARERDPAAQPGVGGARGRGGESRSRRGRSFGRGRPAGGAGGARRPATADNGVRRRRDD